MAAAEVLGTLTSQKEPFLHSDMSTIYSKSQWKFKNHNRIDLHGQHKNMKKHCETHDWLLASHMKMLFLLGPYPTRRDVYPTKNGINRYWSIAISLRTWHRWDRLNLSEAGTSTRAIVSSLTRTYCGWKKSCITLDGWNPVNNGISHLSTGAGFLPSTVWLYCGIFVLFKTM